MSPKRDHGESLTAGVAAFLVWGFDSLFESLFASGFESPLASGLRSAFFSGGFLPVVLKSVAYQPLPLSWKPAALSCFL